MGMMGRTLGGGLLGAMKGAGAPATGLGPFGAGLVGQMLARRAGDTAGLPKKGRKKKPLGATPAVPPTPEY